MASQQKVFAFEAEVRAELARVLQSKAFVRAPTLSKILRYLCEKQLAGETDSIKEYSIAVDALGRAADFDPEIDSIVRVQASRLRKRLAEYYTSEESIHLVRIRLPEGAYIPEFALIGDSVTRREPSSADFDLAVTPALGASPQPRVVSKSSRLAIAYSIVAIGISIVLSIIIILILRGAIGPWFGHKPPVSSDTFHHVGVRSMGGPTVALAGPETRILVGGTDPSFVDSSNQFWMPDQYFTGGVVVSRPDRRVRRTLDQTIFRNAREGDFRYDIPLKPGNYELHLYFAELMFGDDNMEGTGEGNRRFRVAANGVTLISEMDIVNDAAGENTADEKVFTNITPATDEKLHLEFTSLWSRAVLSGIEILPGLPGRMRAVRILAGGGGAYTDSRGQRWESDRYFLGGRALRHAKPVGGTTEQELFRTERFGNFNYAIPVTHGTYSVTLYFAETNFGANNFGFVRLPNGTLQSRLFDVLIGGANVIKNLDVLQESGGAYRALVKTIRGLKPNAQGKLLLSFIPVRDYACVHAIEVTPEQ
jgi:hypothetical protein